MKNNNTIYIDINNIVPHPDNPRKDLGDITELAESIKKNGIMQNLTVIPWEGHRGMYIALIGHRRCAAAKLAGIKDVPCRIVVGLTDREQLSIMLEENMQRNDLTIYEQAQGFQMMLDLGETEDTIAEKTGFSRSTVRHRLNIAKLDQEELQKKNKEEGFQLTLTSLYELEKIKSLETRNKVLRDYENDSDLTYRARAAAKKEVQDENKKIIIQELEKLGVKKAPEKASTEIYTTKWEELQTFEINDRPDTVKLRGDIEAGDKLYYLERYYGIGIIRRAKAVKREPTENEIQRKKIDANRKRIRDIARIMYNRTGEFIDDIISGKAKTKKREEETKDACWRSIVELGGYPSLYNLETFVLKKEHWEATPEEKSAAAKKTKELSVLHQMLIILYRELRNEDEMADYNGHFNAERSKQVLKAYEVLEPYGWFYEDEEKKVLDGTHELYEEEGE